jgi:hypothetical protein
MTSIGFNTAGSVFFPIQLAIGIYMMYSFIGISFLAGIGIIILLGIVITIISVIQKKIN